MWRNYIPILNPDPQLSSGQESSDEDDNNFVSPRRPPQSPSASPRALLVPDQPQVQEVLESAGRALRNTAARQQRQGREGEVVAAAAAAAAVMPDRIVAFQDEDGLDEAGALREACRNVEKIEWDDNDVAFFFSKVEIKMSAVGVKKQYTKFQVLSTVLPKKVEDQLKPILVKTETEFPNKDAYKLLKKEILRIFGPKPERAVERALGRVLVDTPSHLARDLVNDLCKTQLKDCQCCPAIVSTLWKRQLSSQVRAGIAHCQFNAETFNAVVQLADDIHSTSYPAGAQVAALQAGAAGLDETQPAIPYPEVAAIRGAQRGRGGRGRGNRGGNRGGGGQGQGKPQRKGTKHPDLPPGDFKWCNMHFKWGKGSYFCAEPSTCPWKDITSPKPAK